LNPTSRFRERPPTATWQKGAGQTVLDRTGNLKAVQKLLGHASITTTADIYTDWDIDQLAETIRQVLASEMTTNRSREIDRPFASNRGIDAPGRNRTYDLALRRRALYPLSYRR
jgi:hypothetical protein